MSIFSKKNNFQEDKLYNKILTLSRNKSFYTKLYLSDTFQNRIMLIFLHTSFLFIKIKHKNNSNIYNKFYQKMFDYIFAKIEINMREIGFGDVTVNKNMKYLIKVFYDILLNCENYGKKDARSKNIFLTKYLSINEDFKNKINYMPEYFDKYHSFCLDLSSDKVLKGDLNFKYK